MKSQNGVKYSFTWKDLAKPTQNLRTDRLMCAACDSKLGSTIERHAANLILPTDVNSSAAWEALPWAPATLIDNLGGSPVLASTYNYKQQPDQDMVSLFALTVAWRALHAMARNGSKGSAAFMCTHKGQELDQRVRFFINQVLTESAHPFLSSSAVMYFLGFRSASVISHSDDSFPFAWALLDEKQQLGVGVIMGPWVVLWPFFDRLCEPEKWRALLDLCFIYWHGQVSTDLKNGA